MISRINRHQKDKCFAERGNAPEQILDIPLIGLFPHLLVHSVWFRM